MVHSRWLTCPEGLGPRETCGYICELQRAASLEMVDSENLMNG